MSAANSGVTAGNSTISRDGFANLSYDATSNRVTSVGFEYDASGNQTRAQASDGSWLRYEYDSANRLSVVKRDSDGAYLQAYQYSPSNGRLMNQDYISGEFILYANIGGTTLAEYREYTSQVPTWTKSYVYLGQRLLSTASANGTGGEFVEYNHPDRLGTRLITNQATGTVYEQAHLPFGTSLDAESTITTNNRRFTSYDRSSRTGLDYAVNRHYDSKQGRFTRVDPIGMAASNLANPQSFNMYAYVENDPINYTDPLGLLRIQHCTRYWWTDSKGEVHYTSWFCQTIYDDGGFGDGTPAPLNKKEQKKFEKSIKKINKNIQKKRCSNFLVKHGISAMNVSRTLASHQAFSGPRSTDITTKDAGIYSPEEVARLERIIEEGGAVATSAEYELSRSVAQFFKDKDGSRSGRKTGAVVANYNGNPNTAFYRSFDPLKILHESLHIATGLDDKQLAEKLGAGKFEDSELASNAINTALKANGCK